MTIKRRRTRSQLRLNRPRPQSLPRLGIKTPLTTPAADQTPRAVLAQAIRTKPSEGWNAKATPVDQTLRAALADPTRTRTKPRENCTGKLILVDQVRQAQVAQTPRGPGAQIRSSPPTKRTRIRPGAQGDPQA